MVGHVVKMTGSASVVRNGVTVTLNNGDNVLQNDVVQTGSGSSLGLVMIDGTTFNLSAGARLMLNDLTYDAGSTANSSLFTLVQGAASFVAGQVAKTGDMKVGTPIATMGIRGTAVILDVSAVDGKVSISVIDQRDGQTHSVQVFNSRGVLIGTVTSNGSGLTLTPIANFEVIAQESNKTVAQVAQEFSAFQSLLQIYDAGKLLFPDLPQHTDANPNVTRYAFGSPGLTSPGTEYHSPENGSNGQTSSGSGAPVPSTTSSPPSVTTGFLNADPIVVAQVVETAAPVTSTGSLVEDASTATNGTLAVEAVDGSVAFQAVPAAALVGTYGNFTFDESTGAWTYALVHSQADSLAAGQVVHDTLTVTLADGTASQVIDVTIIGTNDVPVLTAGTVTSGSIEVSPPSTLTPGAATLLASGPGLISGLGGESGYGEQVLPPGDDNSSNPIDITSVFGPEGINFFGHAYTSIYINNNGNITFGAPSSTFTPTQIDAGFGNPIIAVFWADVDTRATGHVYYDMDTVNDVMTITWDHVGYYNQHSDKVNSFQIMLVNEGYGNFDIVYRYADIQWTTGDVSGGAPARAGYSAGDGLHYFELPQSGNVPALLSLPSTAGNTSVAGVDQFDVRNGVIGPSTLTTTGAINFSDVDLNDVHTVTSVTYTGGGDQLGILTLVKAVDSTGSGTGGQFVWTYTADPQTVRTALVGAGIHDKIETFDVVISDGHGGMINQTVSITLTATNQAPVAAAVTLAAGMEDTAYTINAAALLAGVIDVDSPSLLISALSVASGGGTVVPNANGTWNYTPAQNYIGPVSFNFTASDGSLSSSSTASLTLRAVNDTPVAAADLASSTENQTLTIDVLANDTDVDDGPVFTLTTVSAPSGQGTASVVGNQVQFVPGTDFDHLAQGVVEQVTLNYTMQDQFGATSTSTVVVTLTGTNDGPVNTVPGAQTVAEDAAIVFNSASGNAISVSDVDVGAGNQTVTLAGTNGALTLAGTAGLSFSVGDGTADTTMTFSGTVDAINIALNGLNYAPTANFHGGTTLTITTNDDTGGGSLSDTKTVAITVTPVEDNPVVTGTTATGSVPSSALTATAASYLTAGSSLVNGLGGPVGFGTIANFGGSPRSDDGSTNAIDIASVFGASGLNLFGHTYTSLYINNNGNITFDTPYSLFTPATITAGGRPIIAPFWADVDTRGGATTATPGGNSMGSNLVYLSLDAVNHVVTVTWDDVGYYGVHTSPSNAFQLQLIGLGNGDFDIVFRYESINWTTGDASGGRNGLGGTPAYVGYSAGDGNPSHTFQLPASGIQPQVLALDSTTGNTGIAGVDVFQVQSGNVTSAPIANGTVQFADPDATDTHTAGFTAGGTGYHGTFTLDPVSEAGGSGSVAWHFALTNVEINNIAIGVPLVQNYTIAVNDGHMGISTQTVSVSVGSAGSDILSAGHAADVLIGAGGNDTFAFSSTSVGSETIVDFTHGVDILQISVAGAGFAGHGLVANAAATVINAVSIGTTNGGTNGNFIFDTTAHALYWDANGGSGTDAVLLAQLQNVNSLSTFDFHLV